MYIYYKFSVVIPKYLFLTDVKAILYRVTFILLSGNFKY